MAENSVVAVHLDEPTNLHFIKSSRFVLFENGVMIDRKKFDDRFANHVSVSELIAESQKDPGKCGWDYKTAIKTTNLQRLGGKKKVDLTPEITIAAKKIAARTAEVAEKKVVDAAARMQYMASEGAGRLKAFFSAKHSDIITMVLFVGILCVVMSIYHTNMFLVESGKMPWVALVAAVAMVVYSASAYTAARHIMQDKGIGLISRLLFSSFLIVSGTFVILFSVFSTTNVSYAQYKTRHVAKVEMEVSKDTTVTSNDELAKLKDTEIENANKLVDDLSTKAEREYAVSQRELPKEAPSEDAATQKAIDRRLQMAMNEKVAASRNYSRFQVSLEAAIIARQKLIDERASLTRAKEAAVTKVVGSQETAYTMVAKKLGMSEETLQFVIYVIPAAFFDVVAPFAVAIVFQLKDRMNAKDDVAKPYLIERMAQAAYETIKRAIRRKNDGQISR